MNLPLSQPPLVSLLQEPGVQSARVAVQKAIQLLDSEGIGRHSADHEAALDIPQETGGSLEDRQGAILQCMEALLFLLPRIRTDQEFQETGNLIVCDLIDPYLTTLLTCAATARSGLSAHVRALGAVLGLILQHSAARDSLGPALVTKFAALLDDPKFLEASLSTNTAEAPLKHADPHSVILVLTHLLQKADPCEIERAGLSLSPLFDAVLQMLRRSELQLCYLLAGSLLPLLITDSHLRQRVDRLWSFVCKVHHKTLTVDSHASDLVLVLLCCFTNVFISCHPASPFSSRLPGFLRAGPACDLRREGVFWRIVQEGLMSPHPLARKRCMFLLQCVLASVRREGGGEGGRGEGEVVVVVEAEECGGVFWWSVECERDLAPVWDDLVLMLETMEEKQVMCVSVTNHSSLTNFHSPAFRFTLSSQ